MEIALVSFTVSLVSLAVALARKHTHVSADLMAERDLALAKNLKLEEELEKTRDELHAALLKVSAESLDQHAARAVEYAEKLGGSSEEKLRHAVGASVLFDKDANGRQDWSDAQHRVAIEAALARRK